MAVAVETPSMLVVLEFVSPAVPYAPAWPASPFLLHSIAVVLVAVVVLAGIVLDQDIVAAAVVGNVVVAAAEVAENGSFVGVVHVEDFAFHEVLTVAAIAVDQTVAMIVAIGQTVATIDVADQTTGMVVAVVPHIAAVAADHKSNNCCIVQLPIVAAVDKGAGAVAPFEHYMMVELVDDSAEDHHDLGYLVDP